MNDEDDEFIDLFDNDICYIDGGNQSGFYLVEDPVFDTRLYCVEDAAAPRIFPIPLKPASLHPKHCLILGKKNLLNFRFFAKFSIFLPNFRFFAKFRKNR